MTKKTKLELTWVGKEAQISPEPRILLEQKDKSYGDPDTENMLIHGDNLLALKSLESEFEGKVKCIYIDPPFNTGSAFELYDDGYEHSIWLSLMRDRLEILNNLLSDDGGIFIHIDYNEEAYLKILCDEVFGRNNYRNTIVVSRIKKNIREREMVKALNYAQDAILFYAKSDNCFIKPPIKYVKKADRWHSLEANGIRKGMDYDLFGHKPRDGNHWRWTYDRAQEAIANKILRPNPKSGKPEYLIPASDTEIMDTNWTDLLASGFSWKFPNGEKNENLIQRIFQMITEVGDLVLDSFLGSGTTAAVAHKMGRRWIGIELGDHAYTHDIPRMQKVIDGTDQGGISKAVNWKGGGGFKFYELASSLIVKDNRGFDVISKEYNGDMLAEAMCKIMGYKYRPDKAVFWKQGKGTENSWLFTTTMTLTEEYLEEIHEELGTESLLICCGGFTGNKDVFKNITIKKIPKSILEKCEWNKPGYPLPVKEDFTAKDFEIEEE